VPLIAILEIVTAPLPVFCICTVRGAEVTVRAVFGKVTDAGLKLSAVDVPVPVSGTLWGDPGPSSVYTRAAEAAIAVCGVNVIVILQLFPGAKVNPQLPDFAK